MMTPTFAFLLTFLISLSHANLLANGDIEQGTDGSLPTSWVSYKGYPQGVKSSDVAHSGSSSISFSGSGWHLAESSPDNAVELHNGKEYILSFWAYSTDANQHVRTEILAWTNSWGSWNSRSVVNKDGANNQIHHEVQQANTWEHFEVRFVPSRTYADVRVNIGTNDAQGVLYIDDVSLVPADGETGPTCVAAGEQLDDGEECCPGTHKGRYFKIYWVCWEDTEIDNYDTSMCQPHPNKYLGGYPSTSQCTYHGCSSFEDTMRICNSRSDCGGVTQTSNGNYQLRASIRLEQSPSGETSWLRSECPNSELMNSSAYHLLVSNESSMVVNILAVVGLCASVYFICSSLAKKKGDFVEIQQEV